LVSVHSCFGEHSCLFWVYAIQDKSLNMEVAWPPTEQQFTNQHDVISYTSRNFNSSRSNLAKWHL